VYLRRVRAWKNFRVSKFLHCIQATCLGPKEQKLNKSYADSVSVRLNEQTTSNLALMMPLNSMLLSTVHPTAGVCTRSFTADDGKWHLNEQNVSLLRSTKHPLAEVVPGLRLQVHCPNPQAPDQPNQGYSHVLSFSVPLVACLKAINTSGVFSVFRETSEDQMCYKMDVCVDTKRLSPATMRTIDTELQYSLDQVLHHHSLMAQRLGGALKSVEQLVNQAQLFREQREQARLKVLSVLSPSTHSQFNLNLNYGRAFGMLMDQEQCGAIREGSVLSHGFQQTVLHLTLAQAGVIAQILQEQDLPMSSAMAEHAIDMYSNTHGTEALWHICLQKVQMGYCFRTKYQFDPSFGPILKVANAFRNNDGSTTVRIAPSFGLVTGQAGEDQNLTPGTNYADYGALNLRDCEDGAMHINACNDLFNVYSLDDLICEQHAVLETLPADIKELASSIFKLTKTLHTHVNQDRATPPSITHDRLSVQTFLDALQKAHKAPCSKKLCATSLLASSPQLASAPMSNSLEDPSSKLDCGAKMYNAWWTNALMQKDHNLNGHAVAIALGLSPVLRISVPGTAGSDDIPVDIQLIDPQMLVYEATAPALQNSELDSAQVSLNLSKQPSTPLRLKLQQDLALCAPLTKCMACNVRSALHTAETKQMIAQKFAQQMQTGASMSASSAVLLPSMIPRQTFSLSVEADSEQELKRQLSFKFYKTLLAVGEGPVFSMDLTPTSVQAYAGISMARQLPNTSSVVVGSPLHVDERRVLHILGALQSSFLLTAEEALASMPPLMPLSLQKRMKIGTDGQFLALRGSDIRAIDHPCGMITQTPLITLSASNPDAVLQNMSAVVSTAQKVIGSSLHFSGGTFADSMILAFP